MKIAITGHKHGIGKEFAEQLRARGHNIVGISRSDGENIRRTAHTTNMIASCDLFINNAQADFAQTDLLYSVWDKWQGQHKHIWNISTMMTEKPVNSCPDGQSDLAMSKYHTQKLALEQASRQLRYKNAKPFISIIRPGGVATHGHDPEKVNTNKWVATVLDIFSRHNTLHISEISIGRSSSVVGL